MSSKRWGRKGAGLLLFMGDKIFLALRSEEVRESNTWAVPGGKVERGETDYEAAFREVSEELGSVPPHLVFDQVLFDEGTFKYVTFFGSVLPEHAAAWIPELNCENDDSGWFAVDDLPQNLHFGIEFVRRTRPDLFVVT